MGNLPRSLAIALVLCLGVTVHGQESRLEVKEAVGQKRFQEDKQITDIELKAQAGSLSRYSLKFDLSYSGPPIDHLTDPQMPNPDDRPRNNRTSLAGYMGLRYRLSSNDALNMSTGLKWYSPIHQLAGEAVDKRPGEADHELANPQLGYDRTYRALGAQMRSNVKLSATTADYYQDRGQIGSVGFAQSLKHALFGSRWIGGLIADFDYYFFDRRFLKEDGRMSNYYLTLIPSVEYKITEALNFKTSIAYSFANLRAADNWTVWDEQMASQRVGVGWAIGRTIYFNPYISFFTEEPAIKTSSLSFSTVFSIF